MWDETNVWDKTEVRRLVTSIESPKRRNWVKTADTSRAGIGKTNTTKTKRKIATAKDQLDKKIVALGLHNFLLTTTVDKKVITKLKKS